MGEELEVTKVIDEETGQETIVVEDPESVQQGKDMNYILFSLLIISVAIGVSSGFFAMKHYEDKKKVHDINERVLEDYIGKTRKLKYSDVQIKASLTSHGYTVDEVSHAMIILQKKKRSK